MESNFLVPGVTETGAGLEAGTGAETGAGVKAVNKFVFSGSFSTIFTSDSGSVRFLVTQA